MDTRNQTFVWNVLHRSLQVFNCSLHLRGCVPQLVSAQKHYELIVGNEIKVQLLKIASSYKVAMYLHASQL